MKVASLTLLALALLVAITTSPATAESVAAAVEPELCRQMTDERILSSPELAAGWQRALRSNDPAEVARMHALAGEIRAAHGCEAGPAGAPGGEAALPPGHPPIPGRGLPPGHPPIPASPSLPLFDAPAVLTI